MKSVVLCVAALSLIVACSARDSSSDAEGDTMPLEEASMSFDLEDVGPFLVDVAALLEDGYSALDAQHLASEIAAMPVDEEKVVAYSVTYQGHAMPLRIEVFMDDVDSPNIYLFAPVPLSEAINREMARYLE